MHFVYLRLGSIYLEEKEVRSQQEWRKGILHKVAHSRPQVQDAIICSYSPYLTTQQNRGALNSSERGLLLFLCAGLSCKVSGCC